MKREIKFNTRLLLASGLTLNSYAFIYAVYIRDDDLLQNLLKSNISLEEVMAEIELTYLNEEDISLREAEDFSHSDFFIAGKYKKFFKDVKVSSEEWIQEYRQLFKGIKPRSMGDPNACLKKMDKFLSVYPQYSKKQILAATENYIRSTEPTYIMQADNFIFKTGRDGIATSRLISTLEDSYNKSGVNESFTEQI